MTEPEHLDEQELERIFQTLNSPLNSSDFAKDVMRRVTRYRRLRRLTLATASIIGLAVSAIPFFRLVNWSREGLVLAVLNREDFAQPLNAEILAATILLAVALPSVLRWLSR
jgi:hypothetical protein